MIPGRLEVAKKLIFKQFFKSYSQLTRYYVEKLKRVKVKKKYPYYFLLSLLHGPILIKIGKFPVEGRMRHSGTLSNYILYKRGVVTKINMDPKRPA